VLIERGNEVGGGDTRTHVGCTAVVRAAEELAEGQLAVIAVGSERIRVDSWLPDDPHPRALVRVWPDEDTADHPGTATIGTDLVTLADEALDLARDAAELTGTRLPEEVALSSDPERRVYELATLTPLGALDRLRVLSTPSLGERIAVLSDLVMEQRILLDARRRFGDG
jgi:Lon protease-like protein